MTGRVDRPRAARRRWHRRRPARPSTTPRHAGPRSRPEAPLDPVTTYTARVAAARDRSGSAIVAPVEWTFTTTGDADQYPLTVWDTSVTPATPRSTDTLAVELGVKFRADVAGHVKGVRFHKGPANGGGHVGHLWTLDGSSSRPRRSPTRARPAGSRPTSPSRCRSSPDRPTSPRTSPRPAATRPRGSAFGPAASTVGCSTSSAVGRRRQRRVPLRQLGVPVVELQRHRLRRRRRPSLVPPDTTGPIVVDHAPATGRSAWSPARPCGRRSTRRSPRLARLHAHRARGRRGRRRSATTPTTDGDAAPRPRRWPRATTYTATVSARRHPRQRHVGAVHLDVHDGRRPREPHRPPSGTAPPSRPPRRPTTPAPSRLGLKFRADSDGHVTGIRFHKGAGNVGPHVGHLWRADGTLLASVPFAAETASGWQQADLATPVPVTAGQTYVVSYHRAAGRYGVTPSGLRGRRGRPSAAARPAVGRRRPERGLPLRAGRLPVEWVQPRLVRRRRGLRRPGRPGGRDPHPGSDASGVPLDARGHGDVRRAGHVAGATVTLRDATAARPSAARGRTTAPAARSPSCPPPSWPGTPTPRPWPAPSTRRATRWRARTAGRSRP